MKRIALVTVGMCIVSTSFAGGYRVGLQGQKALGMGHAGVAMTDSAEVLFFNPAGMVLLESDTDISAGVTLIDSVGKYQNEETNTTAKTDNPIGTPVSLYYSKKYNSKIAYGLGIYTPYGNTVKWEEDWAGSHLVNEIALKTIYVQPTISYKIDEKYSIGFGVTYVNGGVEFNRNLTTALVDGDGNRSNVTIEAEGISSWGYNIGFLAKPIDKLSVGISYRSKVTMKAKGGDAEFENIPASMQATYTDGKFDADLVLPAELTLGIAYDLTPSTVIAFDINRTYWSAYKSLDIDFDSDAIPDSSNARNYKDVNIYRLGVQHALRSNLTLRAGIYVDESPIRDGYFAPETPRNDSVGYTAGLTYEVIKNLDLDFSYLYLRFEEFDGSYDHIVDPNTGNVTSFGGEYKSTVHAFGFGLNYRY
ncbi:MAG: outer membrane protein transport protein [Candidatus Polarisedimenticolaceae bacterium]|nr:outer membrane protein transport protein [Candidatus Polarisedimenticolaceae bacterium]